MNQLSILLYTVFFISIYSCTSTKEKKSDLPIFDPNRIQFTEIKLSDIAQEVSYIQFDSTVLFPGFGSEVMLTEDYIFLATTTGVVKYDRTGKFLTRIGAIGQGPGEYDRYYKFVHNTIDDKLFIFTSRHNILSYSLDGTFLNKIEIEKKDGAIRPSQICQFKDNFYFFYDLFPEYEKPYCWVITDMSGKIISAKQEIDFQTIPNNDNIYHFFSNKITSVTDNSFLYWNEYNDTIFKIDKDKIEPFWLWAKGDFRMTTEKVQNKNWDFLVPMHVIDLNNQILFAMKDCKTNPFNHLFAFYNKRNQTFTGIDKPLTDDINGGLPLAHITNSFNLNKEEYLIARAQPYDLIDALLETDTPKSRELAKTIDDEGNPVMILIKLKK